MSKQLLTLFTFLAILSFGLQTSAQAIKIRACARTTEVDPINDGQGNDQRFKSAFRLDSIHIEEFSPQRTVFARIGVDNQMEWNDGVWVDGCQNNNSIDDCTGCTKCSKPTIDGNAGGSFIGDIRGNARCRTQNNDLFIEATEVKDVCYETEWIDVHRAAGKFLFIKIGYQGEELDGFRTMNIKLNYILNKDNELVNFKNSWSGFLDPQVAEIRTRQALQVSTLDLSDIVEIKTMPNPVSDILTIELNANEQLPIAFNISDLSGRNIIAKSRTIAAGSSSHQLDLSELNSGQYILTLTSGDYQHSKQFIKN